MANDFSSLIPTAFNAANVVSRELVGFIPSVSRSAELERAAVNNDVKVPIAPHVTASDYVPAPTAPAGADRTPTTINLRLTKSRKVSWNLTGEENLTLGENGSVLNEDTIAEGIRTLVNEIENDIAGTYNQASRAIGTSGTTPFGTAGDLMDFANSHQVLNLSGAPTVGRNMVLNTSAMANIRGKQSSLFKVNEAGTDELLRRGIVGSIQNFDVRESVGVRSHTKGTASGATTNNAGYAVGARTITLAAAGTGTIVAGDVITFAGDTNRYVVKTGDSDVSNGGTIEIQEPGLRVAIPAANTAITVANNYVANAIFTRDAIAFAIRPPALVPGTRGGAILRQTVRDAASTLSFDLAVFDQYGQVSIELQAVWGWGVPNPRHYCLITG